ncbi:PREDICTED: interferon alpha-inducible protein 27-like protein 2A [Hipposideros armiger]|uniref:Interferon alpha-inducible protein 27-like protein 2A n=1 Tax=Hipposideros armiger TaxID=186990 RepID=A0A8B7RBB6_HIPAR|nr:PREDICTED: interferon alpha-inducible protein 27-like protein 2A [Hipposideros armiger]
MLAGSVPVLDTMGFPRAAKAASKVVSMISAASLANGGGVAAGSLGATLKSVGAVVLSASSNALLCLIGTSFGAWLGSKIKKHCTSPPAGPSPEAERGPHVGGDSPGPQDESPQNDKPPASQNCSEKDEK